MTVEVHPTGGDTGAEIRGVDISQPLSAEDVTAIEQAFVDHQVLLFRDQPLTDRQFANFSAQLGPLRVHIQAAFRHPEIP